MLKTLRLTNFRAFRDFELTGLGRVNLFVGGNSVGKTSLLTAMAALVGRWPAALFLPILGEYPELVRPKLPWKALLNHANGVARCRLVADWDGQPRWLTVDVDAQGTGVLAMRGRVAELATESGSIRVGDGAMDGTWPLPTEGVNLWKGVGVSSLDLERARDLALEGRLAELLPALRLMEPRLNALEFVGDGLVVAFEGSPRRVPLSVLGDGARAILNVLLIVHGSANLSPPVRLVALDEVDSGLHHSALPQLWEVVARAPDAIQFAITTHRDDSVIAAAKGFKSTGHADELRVIRLERTPDGRHEAVVYSADDALSSFASGWDVRG